MNVAGFAPTVTGQLLPYINADGERRFLGVLPPNANSAQLPKLTDGYSLIPESSWYNISYASYDVPISNQGQHGSCVAHGAWGAFTKSWLINNSTLPEGGFSPTFVYAMGNGGQDQGMVISDAGDILTQYGICEATQFPEGQIWKRDIPDAAFKTALQYKVKEIYHGDSFEAIATGLLMGMIPFYGIYVGNDFTPTSFDKYNVPPAHNQTGNHCMYGDGLTRLGDGRWSIDNLNSWGGDWNKNGRCQLVKGHFNSACDAVLIKVILDNPQETNNP